MITLKEKLKNSLKEYSNLLIIEFIFNDSNLSEDWDRVPGYDGDAHIGIIRSEEQLKVLIGKIRNKIKLYSTSGKYLNKSFYFRNISFRDFPNAEKSIKDLTIRVSNHQGNNKYDKKYGNNKSLLSFITTQL